MRPGPYELTQTRVRLKPVGALSTRRLSMLCLNVAMFTLSWDLVGNFDTGYFNVKLHVIAFALAFFFNLVDGRHLPMASESKLVFPLILGVFLWTGIAAAEAEYATAAYLQVFRNLIASLLPFVVILLIVRSKDDLVCLLTWVSRGMVVVSIFGLYQLFAFYTGLPQIVEYEGLSGGLGRITGFSYEPAYFSHFLLLGLAAVIARAGLTKVKPSLRLILFYMLMFVVTNARIVFLMMPAFLLLVFFSRSDVRIRRVFRYVFGIVVVITVTLIMVSPQVLEFFQRQIASISDESNASNADRLGQYARNSGVIAQADGIFGIGPGNLFYYVGQPAGFSPTTTIANSFWQQTLLDGGYPLICLLLALGCFVAYVTIKHRSIIEVRALGAVWFCLVFIGGAITSNFFTPQVWVALGLLFSTLNIVILKDRDMPPIGVTRPGRSLRGGYAGVSLRAFADMPLAGSKSRVYGMSYAKSVVYKSSGVGG